MSTKLFCVYNMDPLQELSQVNPRDRYAKARADQKVRSRNTSITSSIASDHGLKPLANIFNA